MPTAPSPRSRRSLFRTALVTFVLLAAEFLLQADAGAPAWRGSDRAPAPRTFSISVPDLGPDSAQ